MAAGDRPVSVTPWYVRLRGLYVMGVHHPNRMVRLAAMSTVGNAMLMATWRLYVRELQLATATMLSIAYMSDWKVAMLAAVATGYMAFVAHLVLEPDENVGHRAGAEGYDGPHCENTVEALQGLVARDNGPGGPVKDFHYVEFDVHETRDGELVVFHDASLLRAFPLAGPNVPVFEQLALQGIQRDKASPQDLSLQQLQSLHLAGRPGLHVPTLAAMFSACRSSGLRRPVLVEVKKLASDGGRQRFVQLVSEYKQHADVVQKAHPQHGIRFFDSFVGVIAFPMYWEASFGRLGSAAWRRWGGAFRAAGLRVGCCHFSMINLIRGA